MVVPFDPCNDRQAGFGYVTAAAGRDYADVAPTSGPITAHRTVH
jgi:transglutaminase-like putative cysteine protease